MRLSYAIVFVADMKAIHLADGSANGNDSCERTAGRCRPGLSRPDLDSFHKRMVEKRVACL